MQLTKNHVQELINERNLLAFFLDNNRKLHNKIHRNDEHFEETLALYSIIKAMKIAVEEIDAFLSIETVKDLR